ncbi:MAG: hypothetical protein RBT71_02555 [Flavobacteriales bacterium]|jgi:hypothetical protein|nr:hypothetical protein [Flavobacteriales bacterium]
MRNLLLPVFSLFAVALQAQTPFAPVGAQWTYMQGHFGGPDSTIAVYQVVSDTVLQGRTCSRVTTTEGWFGCHEVVDHLSTSNDSTFYFNEDQQQFHLLFRWNAVPGDTWSTPIGQGGASDTLDWTVSDTGHVVIGGSVLRTLTVGQTSRQNTLYCPLGGVITEQLGGSAPFTWAFGACDAEIFTGLRCYQENIFPMPEPPPPPPIFWLNPLYAQCALSTGIHEMGAETVLWVSPSPVEAGAPFMVTAAPAMAQGWLRVLDGSGRTVLEREVQGSATFRLPHAGMYLVQLLGADRLIAQQRLIVQ